MWSTVDRIVLHEVSDCVTIELGRFYKEKWCFPHISRFKRRRSWKTLDGIAGLIPIQNVLNMAMSRKDALKRIHSLVPRVEEHIDKLINNPTSIDAPHWRAEIRAWLDMMERAADHTGKATSQEWLFKIRLWRLLTDASQ